MQPTPSVSVIIPNYNHALFLKQRIESVLNQTYQDFELIILDDCSTDHSKTIIESYRNHPKVSQIIYNQQNSGSVFKQWRKGIELAKGEYVWIAESDDYATIEFLQETVAQLQKNAALGMVFTNNTIVNQDNETIGFTAENKKNSFQALSANHHTINRENVTSFLLSEMVIENASGAVFRKRNLLQVDFNELVKFINTGDRFTYIGIALQSEILYIPKALNFMRSHANNTTKKSYTNGNIYKDRIRVLNYYFSDLYNSQSRKNILDFYKPDYLSFVTFGEYHDNAEVLKKLRDRGELTYGLYYLVYFYLYLFRKLQLKSRILRGIYYRILPEHL